MITDMGNHLSGLQFLTIGGLALFFLAASVDARNETFAERPSKRAEYVRQARQRAEHDKDEVREWARLRGVQSYHDDGRHVAEIMAREEPARITGPEDVIDVDVEVSDEE